MGSAYFWRRSDWQKKKKERRSAVEEQERVFSYNKIPLDGGITTAERKWARDVPYAKIAVKIASRKNVKAARKKLLDSVCQVCDDNMDLNDLYDADYKETHLYNDYLRMSDDVQKNPQKYKKVLSEKEKYKDGSYGYNVLGEEYLYASHDYPNDSAFYRMAAVKKNRNYYDQVRKVAAAAKEYSDVVKNEIKKDFKIEKNIKLSDIDFFKDADKTATNAYFHSLEYLRRDSYFSEFNSAVDAGFDVAYNDKPLFDFEYECMKTFYGKN